MSYGYLYFWVAFAGLLIGCATGTALVRLAQGRLVVVIVGALTIPVTIQLAQLAAGIEYGSASYATACVIVGLVISLGIRLAKWLTYRLRR